VTIALGGGEADIGRVRGGFSPGWSWFRHTIQPMQSSSLHSGESVHRAFDLPADLPKGR
jgi:hypothetical protein